MCKKSFKLLINGIYWKYSSNMRKQKKITKIKVENQKYQNMERFKINISKSNWFGTRDNWNFLLGKLYVLCLTLSQQKMKVSTSSMIAEENVNLQLILLLRATN